MIFGLALLLPGVLGLEAEEAGKLPVGFEAHISDQSAWHTCVHTYCKIKVDPITGNAQTQAFSTKPAPAYVHRDLDKPVASSQNGVLQRNDIVRGRARGNGDLMFGGEHWHCERQGKSLDCICKCHPDNTCYSMKHGEKHIRTCHNTPSNHVFHTLQELEVAVDHWCSDQLLAISQYGDINRWDVRAVESMDDLFNADPNKSGRIFQCPGGIDAEFGGINEWDVSGVTSFKRMFKHTAVNEGRQGDADTHATGWTLKLHNWDVSSAQTFEEMFAHCPGFQNDSLDKWDTSSATSLKGMFLAATSFNSQIGSWDVSKVTDMSQMFMGCVNFNSQLGDWDVSHVKNFERMFFDARSFNDKITSWNTASATSMKQMFEGAATFAQPIQHWNVAHVQNYDEFAHGAHSFYPAAMPSFPGSPTQAPTNNPTKNPSQPYVETEAP